MRDDTELSQTLRRAQSSAFLGATPAVLWIHDDLLLFSMIVVAVILSFILLPLTVGTKPSVDRAMAAMVGGTGGGLMGAVFALLVDAMWQHTIPVHSMEIMTAAMAGMIGGTIGGAWQLFVCHQESGADGHPFKRAQVNVSGRAGKKTSHRNPFSRAN